MTRRGRQRKRWEDNVREWIRLDFNCSHRESFERQTEMEAAGSEEDRQRWKQLLEEDRQRWRQLVTRKTDRDGGSW